MSGFQIVPVHHEFEPPESFLSRLAAINSVRSMSALCGYVGLNYEKFLQGDKGTLETVADMCGISYPGLVRYAIDRSKNFAVMNGEKVRSEHLIRTRARYCPLCVCSDMEQGYDEPVARTFQRFWWWYEPIGRCVEHKCRLSLEAEGVARRFSVDFIAYVREHMEEVRAEAMSATCGVLDPFELYVHRRLTGQSQEARPILDSVPLHVAVTFCDAVGRLASIGHRETKATVRKFDKSRYRCAGYEIVADGRDAFLEFLSRRVQGAANARGLSKLNKYGSIHARLAENLGNPDWKPMIDLIREDALSTIAFGTGEEVLGYVVEKRRIHSLYSAHVEYGVHPKTIRKLLVNRGVLSGDLRKESYNAVVFEVGEVQDLLELIAGSVGTSHACKTLEIPKKTLQVFRDNGLIRAIGTGDAFGHSWQRYVSVDIERIHAAVMGIAAVSRIPTAYATLGKSHFIAKENAAVVFRLLMEGKVRALRLEGKPMLDAVHFHIEDAMTHTQLEPHDGMTVHRAAKFLATHYKTIERLRSERFFEPVARRHHRTRREGLYYDRQSLQSFADNHVALYAVARERGVRITWLFRSLSRAGVEPIFVPGESEARFYRRAEIDGFFAADYEVSA